MARKKAIVARREEQEKKRAQYQAQTQAVRQNTPKHSTVHLFERFQLIHENCECNLQTLETIEKIMVRLGFSYTECPFPGGAAPHDVYFPTGLTSSDEKVRKAAVQKYGEFIKELRSAGLEHNTYTAFRCLREFLTNGVNGRFHFHPEAAETAEVVEVPVVS